jgi:hypothetical protein
VTGNLLLGEEYLYTKVGKKLKYKCQCNSKECGGIGYCDAGRFPFPNNDAHRQLWFKAMGWDIPADNYELDINLKPSNHCIAYWHFPPSRRAQLCGGQWTLIGRGSPYLDENTNIQYEILVPSNTIESFIEEAKGGSSSSPRKLAFMHEEVPYYLLPNSTAPPPPSTSSSSTNILYDELTPALSSLPPPAPPHQTGSPHLSLKTEEDNGAAPQIVEPVVVAGDSITVESLATIATTNLKSSSLAAVRKSSIGSLTPPPTLPPTAASNNDHSHNNHIKLTSNKRQQMDEVDSLEKELMLKRAREESELLLNLKHAVVTFKT